MDNAQTPWNRWLWKSELKGVLSRVREFLNEQLDACSCEHCGHILVRKHILALYRLDRGSDGKPLPAEFETFSAGDLAADGLPYQAVVLVWCFSWDLGVIKNSPPGSLTQRPLSFTIWAGKLKTFGASARTASGLVNTRRPAFTDVLG
jgi:hypothetical protein